MKKVTLITLVAGLLFSVSFMQSCKKDDSNTQVTMTLYDSLGGTAMVTDPADPTVKIEQGRLNLRSVVDSTIYVIAADPKLNGFFTVLLAEVTTGNTSGFTALSNNLTDFFCAATGSKNFTYKGKNMVAAHDPAQNPRMNGKASSADFSQFVTDLVTGATKCGVSNQLIGQVGAVVATQMSMVVQK